MIFASRIVVDMGWERGKWYTIVSFSQVLDWEEELWKETFFHPA